MTHHCYLESSSDKDWSHYEGFLSGMCSSAGARRKMWEKE